MYLGQLPEARLSVDTAILNINPKKSITGDVYASKLQYDINVEDYTTAEATAKLAVQYSDEKVKRLRWTFILGQLQELNHKRLMLLEVTRRLLAVMLLSKWPLMPV